MANAGRKKDTKNPMNRTQHLDNPPLPIRAIDCHRPVVPATDPESSLSKQSQILYAVRCPLNAVLQNKPKFLSWPWSLGYGLLCKTNPNVGEASVLHIIEKTKQSQFSSFSSEYQGLLEKQSQNMVESRYIPERFVWRFTKRTQNP
jgi:hypothetical protein